MFNCVAGLLLLCIDSDGQPPPAFPRWAWNAEHTVADDAKLNHAIIIDGKQRDENIVASLLLSLLLLFSLYAPFSC
jgi:hypothetical protein